jgi:hypothetical protein
METGDLIMDQIKILEIKLIGAGIIFIALALIVITGYGLGPYLNSSSPGSGDLLIIASHIAFISILVSTFYVIRSIINHDK